jgi:hypothetical protein
MPKGYVLRMMASTASGSVVSRQGKQALPEWHRKDWIHCYHADGGEVAALGSIGVQDWVPARSGDNCTVASPQGSGGEVMESGNSPAISLNPDQVPCTSVGQRITYRMA